jgi:hypothetical protein
VGELVWKEVYQGTHWAYSGHLVIGMVGKRIDGVCYYRVEAVSTRHITKGSGNVKTIKTAKASLQRAWDEWLEEAGLS